MTLLQIYHWLCNWTKFENRSTFGEVTDKSIVGCFFLTDSVYWHLYKPEIFQCRRHISYKHPWVRHFLEVFMLQSCDLCISILSNVQCFNLVETSWLWTFSTNALVVPVWNVVSGWAQAQSVDTQSTTFTVIRLPAPVLIRLSCTSTGIYLVIRFTHSFLPMLY